MSTQITVCFNIIQAPALFLAKLSVLFFYRRIFCGKPFDIMSWTLIGIVILWFVGSWPSTIFQCGIHFTYLWSSAENVAEHCARGTAIAFGLSVPDVVTDIMILSLPVYWVKFLATFVV